MPGVGTGEVAVEPRFQPMHVSADEEEDDEQGGRRRKGLRATLRKNAPLLAQTTGTDGTAGGLGGPRRSGMGLMEELGKRWGEAMPGFLSKRSSSVGLTAGGAGTASGTPDGRFDRGKAVSVSPSRGPHCNGSEGSGAGGGEGKESGGQGGPSDALSAAAAAAAAAATAGRPPGEEGLRRVALKFTTVSEGPDQPSFVVDTEGAAVGRGAGNKMSVPSDTALAENDHAFITWLPFEAATTVTATAADAAGAAAGSSTVDGASAAAGSAPATPVGGHFYLRDGGTGADFAAAVRIRIGTGSRQWPLKMNACFSAGNSVFRVIKFAGIGPRHGGSHGDGDSGGERGEAKGEGKADESQAKAGEGKDGEGKEGGVADDDDDGAAGRPGGVFGGGGDGDGGSSGGSLRGSGGSPHSTSPRIGAGVGSGPASSHSSSIGATAANAGGSSNVGSGGGGGGGTKDFEEYGGADQEGGEPRVWLEALTGPLKGEVKVVTAAGATLGRATDNFVSIADKELSRRHSKVEYDPEIRRFFLCDVGSLNGTYMQLVGPYAGPPFRLALSDHILVGRTGFSVNRFDYGVSERMGSRPTMEDKSTVYQDLEVPGLHGPLLWPQTFVGVYDGHGGNQASEYLWTNLHFKVKEALARRAPELARLAVLAMPCLVANPEAGSTAATNAAGLGGTVSGGSGGGGGGGGSGDDGAPLRGWGPRGRATPNGRGGPAGGSGGGSGSGGGPSVGGGDGSAASALDACVHTAIAEAFRAADEEFIATADNPEAGSTATTCLILGNRIHIANVGDSRTVLVRSGAVLLASKDHKPQREDEHERIRAAGGFIVHKRVMGELAVSRAFGDAEFKRGTEGGAASGGGGAGVRVMKLRRGGANNAAGGGSGGAGGGGSGPVGNDSGRSSIGEEVRGPPLVTSEPEFEVSPLTAKDEFLLLGCDGLFDVYSSAEAAREVRETLARHGDTQRACEVVTNAAIQDRGTRDNVTVVVLVLNRWWGSGS